MDAINLLNVGIVNTSCPSWELMHDTSQPFALVEFNRKGWIRKVISRHPSMIAAAKNARRRLVAINRWQNVLKERGEPTY